MLTALGRYGLAHVAVVAEPAASPRSGQWPPPQRPAPAELLSGPPVELAGWLVDALRSLEGGTLWIREPTEQMRRAYRRAVHAAKKNSLFPDGFVLLHTGRDRGDIVLRLCTAADMDDSAWNSIRSKVANETTIVSEIVAVLAENQGGLRVVDDSLLPAAVELGRRLIETARARGHRISLYRGRLVLQPVGGSRRDVYIQQEYDRVAHVATAQETQRARRDPWTHKIPEFDSVPARRLQVFMNYEGNKRDRWEAIPESGNAEHVVRIFEEIEAGIRERAERFAAWKRQYEVEQQRRRAKEQEQHQRWSAAMAEARGQATTSLRAAVFESAFEAWLRARDLRDFCAQLRSLPARSPAEQRNVSAWVEWGLATADDIDPTVGEATLANTPFDVRPEPDDLRPFLDQWSPYGPYFEQRNAVDERRVDHEPHQRTWHPGLRNGAHWWRRSAG